MNYYKMVFRNLFRHKLRTTVSIAAIAVSIIAVVFTRGLIMGYIDSVFSDHIHYQSGHIRIINEKYRQKERLLSLNYPVSGFEDEGVSSMISKLENIEGVKMVVPRLEFGAVVSTDRDLIKMAGWGVDPGRETRFTELEDQLVKGRMIRRGKMEVIMGSGLLQKLDREVGDTVTILYNTSFNSFKGATFNIVGEIESGLKLLNDTVFYLPLDQAQRLLYLEGNVTELLLVIEDMNMAKALVPEVKELFARHGELDKYAIIPWNKSGGMVYLMQIARNMYNVIYIFLVVLASFVVINTMVMIVKERTREIGMMTALGLKSKELLKMFLLEGLFMGIIGSFVGALLGGVVTRILADIGIDYSKAFEGVGEEVLMKPIIYPVFSIENMIFGFGLGVIVTAVACIIPARRAARLEPTEALREI